MAPLASDKRTVSEARDKRHDDDAIRDERSQSPFRDRRPIPRPQNQRRCVMRWRHNWLPSHVNSSHAGSRRSGRARHMKHEVALSKALSTQNEKKQAAAPSGFDGVWKNQLGSSMDLKIDGANVTGIYTSKKSLKKDAREAIGDIVGFVDDDIISLVVKWRGVSAMTSWVGQIVTQNKKDSLSTLWHLISNTPEEQEEDLAWAAILTGADIFHR
ncbi:hypothetical protein FVE89_16400 [Methylobacterium sp. 2A]|jgi:hypothetical protein|nr:hypothetical protein [Methylobacterium sp. 2A]